MTLMSTTGFRKFVAVVALAGTMGALATTSADADPWGRRGYGGGNGYRHYGGGYGNRGYGYRHGGNWGGAGVAAGLLGGLAVGAIASQGVYGGYPAYGYGGYGGCYIARQPIVDAWGNVISYQRVQVCQ